MLSLGPLAFAAPAALFGLLALPLLWLLLRATPPAPRRRLFPPLRLLLGLDPKEETPQRTPWWLTALRLTLAGLLVIGLARPTLFPEPAPEGAGPLILVIDDGWASGARWERMRRAADAELDAAAQAGRRAALILTAPTRGAGEGLALAAPAELKRRLSAHDPRPWPVDRAAAAERLAAARASGDLPANGAPVWIADGVGDSDGDKGGARALSEALGLFGAGRVYVPEALASPLGLRPPDIAGERFAMTVLRADADGPRDGAVIALDADGRGLARAPFQFADGERTAKADIALPLELRNRVALVRVEAGASAGAAHALDDRWRRPRIGLVTTASEDDRQPLLADLHYVEEALAPSAETRRGELDELLNAKPGALVLTDAGRVVGPDTDALARFVAEGGLLIRFAGPRLAARSDDLTPVQLRVGDRALGGALAWDQPQPLAPFPATSPFADLKPAGEVTITRQVLAEPAPDLAERTWARLADGTPLVTAERRGRGWIVLFHVTASPEWSSLPLSGLFVEMLQRVTAYADASAPVDVADAEGPWRLDAALQADGRLAAPPADAPSVAAAALAGAGAGPMSPPGRWRRGGASRAVNVLGSTAVLTELPPLADGLTVVADDGPAPRPLGGALMIAALLLLAADAAAAAWLAGGYSWMRGGWRRAFAGSAAVIAGMVLVMAVHAPAAHAQEHGQALDDAWAVEALHDLRFGYVKTGDPQIDDMSRAGLDGLGRQLWRRTSVEPGEPLAVDIERDEISLLPMLYWVVTENAAPPTPGAAAKIDAYLKNGGVIVFDTRDAASAAVFGGAAHPGLARLVDAIDVPPLRQVPEDHVLTKSFYLLQEFPGRWRDGAVWVEADAQGSARDGVSSVIVGSADWAAAWAVDERGYPIAAVTPGGERQREMAYRFGVNLVMYVLTGNYKADQVHVPAILERLGQ